jgi:hypothetical protein
MPMRNSLREIFGRRKIYSLVIELAFCGRTFFCNIYLVMKITQQDILTFFDKCEADTTIPGVLSGKNFKFMGLKKYLGKGDYSHLHEKYVIVIEAGERRGKRNLIKLFPEPLMILSNCTTDEIGYGKVPSAFVALKSAGQGQTYPNLYEYETHYKAVARFIKNHLISEKMTE